MEKNLAKQSFSPSSAYLVLSHLVALLMELDPGAVPSLSRWLHTAATPLLRRFLHRIELVVRGEVLNAVRV